MDKSELDSCLKKVFFDDWTPDETVYWKKLLSLVTYYADEELTPDLQRIFNELHAVLVSVEMLEKLCKMKTTNIPAHYTCELEARRPGAPIPDKFTFAPLIKLPECVDISIEDSKAKKIEEAVKGINFAALAMYVKRKAAEAGDLPQ